MRLTGILSLAAATAMANAAAFYTWQNGVDAANRAWTAQAEQAVSDLAIADRSLQRDLLSARAGLLRNYDPLNADTKLARGSARRLVGLAAGKAELLRTARTLVTQSDAREALCERFKTDNALLQNSLSRFALIDASAPDIPAREMLGVQVLRLTLETSAEAVTAARLKLDQLARAGADGALIPHAQLLSRLLPEVDRILIAIRDHPIDREIGQGLHLIGEETRRQSGEHRLRRNVAIASGALSLVLFATVLVRLRRRSVEVRRQVANQHLEAAVSRLMIDVRPDDLADRIRDALPLFAHHAGADRAYLCLDRELTRLFRWSSGAPLPDVDWVRCVHAFSDERGEPLEQIVSRVKTDRQGDALDEAMSAVSVNALMLVRSAQFPTAILGLESSDKRLRVAPEFASGLVVALSSVLIGVRRDAWGSERRRLEQRLAQAQRMETIGAMASGVAHNFNNIISAIAGFAEIGEAHTRRGSVARSSLDEIRQAVARASALVEAILCFGRRPRSSPRLIPVADLLRGAARLLQASIPGHVDFFDNEASAGMMISGNAGQLEQVLINICKNAVIASGEAQYVKVTARRRVLDASKVLSHATLEAGAYVAIAIADKGVGIAASTLPKIFMPFFTTRQSGTGLGLSTAWEIIFEHGGTIDVSSTPGRGSRFVIWLPLVEAASKEPRPGPDGGHGERILLATSDASRACDEELVASLGYEPIVLDDLDVLAFEDPPRSFDAAILIDAHEATVARLRAFLPALPILLAAAEPGLAGAGAHSVTYPFDLNELAQALAACLTSSRDPADFLLKET